MDGKKADIAAGLDAGTEAPGAPFRCASALLPLGSPALYRRLSSSWKKGRLLCTRPRHGEEIGDRHVEGLGEAFQHADGRVFHAALHAADVGPVDLGIDREGFLGNAALHAKPPHVPGHQFTGIHARYQSLPEAYLATDDGHGDYRHGV